MTIGRNKKQSSGSPSSSFPANDSPGTFSSINLDSSPSYRTESNARPPGKKAEKKRQREGQPPELVELLGSISSGRREHEASRRARHEVALELERAKHEESLELED